MRKSCRRRFRNTPYGEKILMGKSYVWASFRNTCICSSMRGRYKIQIAEGWKWQRIFCASPSKNGGSKSRESAACVRCGLHPLPVPLSSCLDCIPPFIGLPFLRFYVVFSSLFILFVFFFLMVVATMFFAGYFIFRSLLSAFPAYLRTSFRLDFVWFRLSCVHGWVRSGSVNVR